MEPAIFVLIARDLRGQRMSEITRSVTVLFSDRGKRDTLSMKKEGEIQLWMIIGVISSLESRH